MAAPRTFKMTVADGAVVEVKMSGWITEKADLDIEKIPAGRPVVIDVGDVRVINSLGCRDWMRFLSKLSKRTPSVTIRRLSPMLAFHASTIRNFLGPAHVESVLSPWMCSRCEHYVEYLQDARAELPSSLPCPKCGSEMVLDTFEGVYENIDALG